jgi:hypothetical protein
MFVKPYTVKKRSPIFLSHPDITNQTPWPGKIKLFPARESLVSDIPAGDGKKYILFTVYELTNRSYRMSVFQDFPLLLPHDWKSKIYEFLYYSGRRGNNGHSSQSTVSGHMYVIFYSVVDPLHFGTDPDPRICTTDLWIRIRILLLWPVAQLSS